MFCVYYLIFSFQWREAFAVLSSVRIGWCLVMGSITIGMYWFLRAFRWFYLLRNQAITVSFSEVFLSSSMSLAFSIVTPFQTGEIIKVEWLKRRGIAGRTYGYGVFAVERGMDLSVVVGGGAISIFASGFGFLSSAATTWLLLVVLIGVAVCGWVFWGLHLKGKARDFLDIVRSSLKTPLQGAVAWMLTVGAWLVTALGWQVCLVGTGLDIDFIRTTILTLCVTMINILSMVPGALGVSEVTTAEFLIHWGYSFAESQAGALSLRLYSLLILIFGAALFIVSRFQTVSFAIREREPLTGKHDPEGKS